MDCTIKEYLKDVRLQLTQNCKEDAPFITYDYSEKQIQDNVEYFEKCMKRNLSGYKALLFFNDYLKGEEFLWD